MSRTKKSYSRDMKIKQLYEDKGHLPTIQKTDSPILKLKQAIIYKFNIALYYFALGINNDCPYLSFPNSLIRSWLYQKSSNLQKLGHPQH